MNIEFGEHIPSDRLKPYIQSYWSGNFNINADRHFSQSVLPNGCIELIIHLTHGHCALSSTGDHWASSPEFTLLGVFDKPYEVHFSQNVRVFGIRFYPDGIRNIFGAAPTEFLATYEDATYVLGVDIREFCLKLRELKTTQEQIYRAERFLKDQLERNEKAYDYTHFAMAHIRQNYGLTDYSELTNRVPISKRQLQREFKNLYGMSVVDYMRLSRMNAIHRYMMSQQADFTKLTYDLRFSDQSHFIREFKNFVGLTPKRFVKSRDHFIVNPTR